MLASVRYGGGGAKFWLTYYNNEINIFMENKINSPDFTRDDVDVDWFVTNKTFAAVKYARDFYENIVADGDLVVHAGDYSSQSANGE